MANEGRGTCEIIISGTAYRQFVSMNLRCSRPEATCSGTVVLSWQGTDQFSRQRTIAADFGPGAKGQIKLDGQLAATIAFDTRVSKGTPKDYELTLTFRGQQSLNVDSSTKHTTGQFNEQSAFQIIDAIKAEGTKVVDESGDSQPIKRFIVATGESRERTARRAAAERSLNFWERPDGAWVLEKIKSAASSGLSILPADVRLVQQGANVRTSVGGLTLGRDFTQWQVKQNIIPRFTEIEMVGNGIATDQRYGKINESILAPEMLEFANKVGVGRTLTMLVDTDQDKKTLKERATYEQEMRDKQAVQATLVMSTWSDNSGQLWRLADKWHVSIPVDQIDHDLEIDAIEFELTKDSRTATLMLIGKGGGGIGDIFGSRNVEQFIEGIGNAPVLPPPIEPGSE